MGKQVKSTPIQLIFSPFPNFFCNFPPILLFQIPSSTPLSLLLLLSIFPYFFSVFTTTLAAFFFGDLPPPPMILPTHHHRFVLYLFLFVSLSLLFFFFSSFLLFLLLVRLLFFLTLPTITTFRSSLSFYSTKILPSPFYFNHSKRSLSLCHIYLLFFLLLYFFLS